MILTQHYGNRLLSFSASNPENKKQNKTKHGHGENDHVVAFFFFFLINLVGFALSDYHT